MLAPRAVSFGPRSSTGPSSSNAKHTELPLKAKSPSNRNDGNENMVRKSIQEGSKTPLSNRTRRAFGDISNKKHPDNSSKQHAVSNVVSLKTRLNSTSSSSLAARSGIAQAPKSSRETRIPSPREFSSSSFIPKPSSSVQLIHQKAPLSRLPSLLPSKTASNAIPQPGGKRVDFLVPQCQLELTGTEPLPDVERPAGRTWEQQQHFYDDDEISKNSVDEFLEQRTMWDDWKHSIQKRQAEEERIANENADREIARLIEESDGGIETLVDGMGCFDVDKDNTSELERLLEDDEWSAPASSLLGDIDDFLNISIQDDVE